MNGVERSSDNVGHHRRAVLVVGSLAAVVVLAAAGSFVANSLRPAPSPTADPYATTWSALEWRDITATAFSLGEQGWDGNDEGQSFVDLHGRLFTNPGGSLWTSTDGQTWQRVDGSPVLNVIFATSEWLLGATTPLRDGQCMNRLLKDLCLAPTQLWYSWDGFYWVMSSMPGSANSPGVVTGLALNASRAVAIVSVEAGSGDSETRLTRGFYASTDGASWVRASLPPDIARSALITVTRYGFVVSGVVVHPSAAAPPHPTPDRASWSSPDGLRWASYHPEPVPQTPFNVLSGRLGDAMPMSGLHSPDGLTWKWDATSYPCPYTHAPTSNGQEIVLQAGDTYCVSLGDGRWRLLRQEGVPGSSRPMGGRGWAIPGGVICVWRDRVFYGKGLIESS